MVESFSSELGLVTSTPCLCLPTASSSSMKTIHGAFYFAFWKTSLTLEAPTPWYIQTNWEAEIDKKGTPASPATAFAKRVLPVPGGPTKSAPFGIVAPIFLYFSGYFRKSIISSSSYLASSTPSTLAKVVSLLGSFSIFTPEFLYASNSS